MNLELSVRVGEVLRPGGKLLAVAESCTGGLLGGVITAVPGSSDYFLGGLICYADRIKRDLLGVPGRILEKHGAVSPQVTASMAERVCELFGAECAIAVSGIAGPGGGTPEKPVGLVYIAVKWETRVKTFENQFKGDRERIRVQTCRKALDAFIGMQ